jgi:hypothetical protein
MTMKKIIVATIAAAALSWGAPAMAQSGCPTIINGAVLTAGQWNACFAAKQNTLGYVPVNKAGDTMLGPFVTFPSATLKSGFNVPPGAAPASPINGDMWSTSAGFFVRVNGVTIGPLAGATGSSFAGTSPITVSYPAGVVTYAFDFTVANTFLAQQTNQGATTTSPGWYAQLAGDTVPRVRVGLNAVDVASIGFGSGSATRDTFIERAGAAALRHGAPDAAAPVAQTIGFQNVVAGTSNAAGADATMAGSRSTGSATGGGFIFQTSPLGTAGTSQNALVTALRIYGTGGVTVGSAPTGGDQGAGKVNVSGGYYVNGALISPTGAGLTGQMLNGVTSGAPAWTYAPTLGASGTAGSLAFGNATSGTVTLQPVTGALGSVTAQLPANSGILAELNYAQTWSALQGFNDNDFGLNGSSSGNLILRAAAVSGSSVVRFPAGSTDFSATGGTSNVLRQSSAGAAITVGQLAASDLSNGTSGSGAVCLVTNCALVTPSLGVATATSMAIGGATIGANALAVTGTSLFNSGVTMSAALTYGGVTLSNAVTGTGPMVLGTNASLMTPNINLATGTSLALNGCSISTNALCATGSAVFSGTVTGTDHIAGASNSIYWTGRSTFTSPADGIITLNNNAGTAFSRLQFGGTTSSFPAAKRNAAALNFRLADDSADAAITAAAGSFSGAVSVTSASATALAVGLNGATNPALLVDASTAFSATGIKIKSAAAGGGVAISVITSGTNENLALDAAGSGTIVIGGTSTGAITLTRATTLSAALTYGGVTLTNAVTGTGRMVLDANSTIAGLTVTGSFTATGLVTNASLANPATTVNGQTCTLGSTCTITAAATGITVNTTNVTGATAGKVLYSDGTLLQAYTITGTAGSVVMSNAPSIVGGSITALTALAIRDTSAAFDVTLAAVSSTALTAGRALTFDVVNAARTVKLGANLTIATDPGAVTGALKSNGAGTFAQAACGDLSNAVATCSSTDAANLSGTLASARISGSYTGITGVGTLAAGTLTTGVTINGASVTWGSQIAGANVAIVANASGSPSATFGVFKADGTTIQCTTGVCTAVGAAATSISAGGSTSISSGLVGYALTNSGGNVANNQLFSTAGGNVNKFRNGTFLIWQRGTTSLYNSGGTAIYTADGWQVTQATTSGTCSRDTGNNGALYSLKCIGAASNTGTTFLQRIESSEATSLAGATVTVQFQYKQSTGGAITPKVSTCYASAADNFSTCTADLAATSVTSCAASTWCTESYTFTANASATNGYQITLDCNTGLTAGQACWISAADVRVTPGVATGVNSNPPAPELRNLVAEQTQSFRYFEKSYSALVAPGTAQGAGSVGLTFTWPTIAASQVQTVQYKVLMRLSSPSLSIYDSAGTAGKVDYLNCGVAWVANQPALTSLNNDAGFSAYTSTSGCGMSFGYGASAEL